MGIRKGARDHGRGQGERRGPGWPTRGVEGRRDPLLGGTRGRKGASGVGYEGSEGCRD